MDKTNAMRMLDRAGIAYTTYEYDGSVTDGMEAARRMGLPPEQVFKTLVTESADREYLVFVIPVCCKLDLKKAARAAHVKSLAMLPQKQLFPLTGYVHGGCSPIGMKKQFRTFLDETAQLNETMVCNAGHVGKQICLPPDVLSEYLHAPYADLTEV